MWRSSFLVNLEACRLIAGNFTIKWTPSKVFFDGILSSSHAPPMFWLKPSHQILRSPPMFATPVGNPELKNLYQILFLFYKESFMLFKKAVNNGLTLELNTLFDFQLISNFFFFYYFKASSAKWKTLEKN